jgi:hypothetical protein
VTVAPCHCRSGDFVISRARTRGGVLQGKGDTRVSALQSFLDTYRERLVQEAQPDPNGIDWATLTRLLPRPSAT